MIKAYTLLIKARRVISATCRGATSDEVCGHVGAVSSLKQDRIESLVSSKKGLRKVEVTDSFYIYLCSPKSKI